jgi:tetratricopeptide (TPR) repeat protein
MAALYAPVDLVDVPVERLIQNMEQIAAASPGDARIRINLARVHAMAYALKMTPTQTTKALRNRDADGAWFGYEARPVPFSPVSTDSPALAAVAREHLEKALDLYRQGIQLDPTNTVSKLGYAWCLDQAGNRGQAISAYRQVIAEAWAIEEPQVRPFLTLRRGQPVDGNLLRTSTITGPGWFSLTAEASRYLIPLLDREKDADEIATLVDRQQAFDRVPRAITPIVVPLRDHVAIEDIVDMTASVSFDADGSALPRRWTWITPEAGWLVHAPNESRPITSALQMFGSVTFWMFWENGYEAMAALDDNHDGTLSGTELDGLAIWWDSNRNGQSERGEVKPLDAWGIVGLSCRYEKESRPEYAALSSSGVRFADGKTKPTYDVILYSQSTPRSSD